jgi:hypothetical protein
LAAISLEEVFDSVQKDHCRNRWLSFRLADKSQPFYHQKVSQMQTLVTAIALHHAEWTVRWHENPTPLETGLPLALVEQNHRMNFDLWHEEDMARRDDLGAERVRQAKRAIDRFNQARNDAMKRLDAWVLSQLPPARLASPLHSETPGMMVDRLSILALKLYHMRIEATRESATGEHRRKCSDKCTVLDEQLGDLKNCLEELLEQLQAGTRRFKIYRQLKMYNDASLNPQLYGNSQKQTT